MANEAERRRLGAGPRLAPATRSLSPQAQRHIDFRRDLLQRNPELRRLMGANPWTALAPPLILAVHWTTAWAVSQTNILVVFLVAFFFGQIVIHAAGALVHETAHRLIFRHRLPKLAFDLQLELITGSFARQLTYQHEHITSHHPQLGNYERDYEHEDVCRLLARRAFRRDHPRWQRLATIGELAIHLLPLGFLLADQIVPRFYRRATGRPVRDGRRAIGASRPSPAEKWLFIGVSVAANVFLFAAFGVLGWLYHVWSLSLFLGKCGVTNLGQSLSEHAGDDFAMPTRSTYWWGNRILFNTGYHNEHHSFPDIPWSRLPTLRATAPDAFAATCDRSYVHMWWDHIRADFSPSRQNPFLAQPDFERCGTDRR
jgi:sphingolipid delta-4 desaturase